MTSSLPSKPDSGLSSSLPSYSAIGKILRIPSAPPVDRLALAERLLPNETNLFPHPACLVAEHCVDVLTSCSAGEKNAQSEPFAAKYWTLLGQALDNSSVRHWPIPKEIVMASGKTIGIALKEGASEREMAAARACVKVVGEIVERVKGVDLLQQGILLEVVIDSFLRKGIGGNLVPEGVLMGLVVCYGKALGRCTNGKRALEAMTRSGCGGLARLVGREHVSKALRSNARAVIESGLLCGGIAQVCKKLLDYNSYFSLLYSWLATESDVEILGVMLELILKAVVSAIRHRDFRSSEGVKTKKSPAGSAEGPEKAPGKLSIDIQVPLVVFRELCGSARKRLGAASSYQEQNKIFRALDTLFKVANELEIYHASYENASRARKNIVSGLSTSGEVSAVFMRVLSCMVQTSHLRRIVETAVQAAREIISFSFESLERLGDKIISILLQLVEKSTRRFELDQLTSLLISVVTAYVKRRQLPSAITLLSSKLGFCTQVLRLPAFQSSITHAISAAPRGHVLECLNSVASSLQRIIEEDDSDDERVSSSDGRNKMMEQTAVLVSLVIEAASPDQLNGAESALSKLIDVSESCREERDRASLLWIKAAACQAACKAGWHWTRLLVDTVVSADDWKSQIDSVVEGPPGSTRVLRAGADSLFLARARLRVGIAHVAALEAQQAMVNEVMEAEACRIGVVRACKASLSLLMGQMWIDLVSPSSEAGKEIPLTCVEEHSGTMLVRTIAGVLPLIESFARAGEGEEEDLRFLIRKFLVAALIVNAFYPSQGFFQDANYWELSSVARDFWGVAVCLGSNILSQTGLGARHRCQICDSGVDAIRLHSAGEAWKVVQGVLSICAEAPVRLGSDYLELHMNLMALGVIASSDLTGESVPAVSCARIAAFNYLSSDHADLGKLSEQHTSKLIKLIKKSTLPIAARVLRKLVRQSLRESSPARRSAVLSSFINPTLDTLDKSKLDRSHEVLLITNLLNGFLDAADRQQLSLEGFPEPSLILRCTKLVSSTLLDNDPGIVLRASASLLRLFSCFSQATPGTGLDMKTEDLLGKSLRGLIDASLDNCKSLLYYRKSNAAQDLMGAVREFLCQVALHIWNSSSLFSEEENVRLRTRLIAVTIHGLSHAAQTVRCHIQNLLNYILNVSDWDTVKCITSTLIAEVEDAEREDSGVCARVAAISGARVLLCGVDGEEGVLVESGVISFSGYRVRSIKHIAGRMATSVLACSEALTAHHYLNEDHTSRNLCIQGIYDALSIAVVCAAKPSTHRMELHHVYLLLQRILDFVKKPRWVRLKGTLSGTVGLCTNIVRHYGNNVLAGSTGVLPAVSYVVKAILSYGDLLGVDAATEISRLYGYVADRALLKVQARRCVARALLGDTATALTRITSAAIRRSLMAGVADLMTMCSQSELTQVLLSLKPDAKRVLKNLRQEYLADYKFTGKI